jgi:hypothetical protein
LAAVVLLILLRAVAPVEAIDLTFRATTGDAVTIYTDTVQAVQAGFHADVMSSLEHSTMDMDGNLQTLSWTFKMPSDRTEIEARLSGRTIALRGIFKGSTFAATFDTGGLPWYEYQELSLNDFGAGQEQSLRFVTVDRSSMKLVTFKVQKKGPSEILVQGVSVPAVEAVLLIEGIPEFLLRSRLWLRRTDGRYLRLSVPPLGGIGSSTLVELTGESGGP